MDSTPFDDGLRRKNSKTFRLEHQGRTMKIALEHVVSKTRDRVQIVYVDYGEGQINRWDYFKDLVEKKLGYKINVTRQAFIDKIYFETQKLSSL